MNLEISYGVGCGSVDYHLVTDGLFMESNPVQLKLKLICKDQDPCEASIQLIFNLTPVASEYLKYYSDDIFQSCLIHCPD